MAEAPTGTVTLLFTDIEGSTRLWETQPTAMRAALARHDALMRHCISYHRGHLFKTGGDAFYAAFHTASDAISAALAAQRALHREPWPETAKLRVRMALHSGAVELRDADYFGAPLNRVARLLAAAHGGQTLVSESTHNLCRDDLPPLASLNPLGAHALKDLARREAVFQLCHPDLPETFPPLRSQATPLDEETPSIAVLPFVNMSRNEDDEYFADGLAEELLNVLTKIRGLRVAARSSAFTFKGKGATVAEVGRTLNVATVLEGSVRKAGDRLRISVQLVNVADGYHVWSQRYDRTLEDIFAVQDDIAQSVVKELRTTLLGEAVLGNEAREVTAQVAIAVKGRATDAEAYQFYLQARYFIERDNREDTTRAFGYLERALVRDPAFALAWTELARAHMSTAGHEWVPAATAFERAREAVASALASEPDLAEGYTALGWIQMMYDWDWSGAEASYVRALALAPGNAAVLRRAGVLHLLLGRYGVAIGLFHRSIEKDPLNGGTYSNLGIAFYAVDRLDEAAELCRKALELAPQQVYPRATLALVLVAQGRPADALAEASLLEAEEPMRVWLLAIIHHAAGCSTEAQETLEQLISKQAATSAYRIAQVYAARGEIDFAFEWLERAFVQRDAGLAHAKIIPLLRPLHVDRRWPPFMRKMGFVD